MCGTNDITTGSDFNTRCAIAIRDMKKDQLQATVRYHGKSVSNTNKYLREEVESLYPNHKVPYAVIKRGSNLKHGKKEKQTEGKLNCMEPSTDITSNSTIDVASNQVITSTSKSTQHQEGIDGKSSTEEGSFVKCSVRYNGSDKNVSDFTYKIQIFKNCEEISDENALKGLPLLLEGKAAEWWRSKSGNVNTWHEAINLIKITFSRPGHEVYKEIFRKPQSLDTSTKSFISGIQTLFDELLTPPNETTQLDMVYHLLHYRIREKIYRNSVSSLTELVKKATEIEQLEEETRKKPRKYEDESEYRHGEKRRKIDHHHRRHQAPREYVGRRVPNTGAEDLISRDPTTSNNRRQEVAFCAISANRQPRLRPTITINIAGEEWHAYVDTGATCCVASQSLFAILQRRRFDFVKQQMQITLADGNSRIRDVFITYVEVKLQGKTTKTQFVVFPESEHDCILLGMDFLKQVGLVLNIPQRCWYFGESPLNKYDFDGEHGVIASSAQRKETTILPTIKTITLPLPEAQCAPPPPLLSPIGSPEHSTQGSSKQEWSDFHALFDKCVQTCETVRPNLLNSIII